MDPIEIWFDHGLRSCHLGRHGDLGRGPVAPVLWNGRHVDVIGGERGQVLKAILVFISSLNTSIRFNLA
jgi:hypothetical protein